MKLGIMQPYFFPYLGYYDLINRTDRWIVFDVVKYVPKSWMNRNRVLHPTEGWQYVSVPVNKHHGNGTIAEVTIAGKQAARGRILGQLEHYRHGRAPFFERARELVDRAFAETSSDLLCELNAKTLALVCAYLGIPFNSAALSEMNLTLPPIEHPGQWALEISSALNASEYINPPGGRSIFRPEEFAARNIALSFTDVLDFRYPTEKYEFVERLSIIDAIMWNEPEVIKGFLDDEKQKSLRLS